MPSPDRPRLELNAGLLSSRPDASGAGISTYVARTLRALAETQADCAPAWQVQVWLNRLEHPGLPFQRRATHWHVRRPIARIMWEQTALPLALRVRRPDLFHGMVNVLPIACPVPSLVTVMDLSFLRTRATVPGPRRRYLQVLCGHSARRASRVLAISRATANDVRHYFDVPSSRIEVVPVPAEPQVEAPADSPDFVRSLPDNYLLHLGTLEPRKNLGWLIEAFAAWLEHTGADWHLVLAGAPGWGGEPARLEAAVRRLGLTEKVWFPGWVPPSGMHGLYGRARAVVLPSLLEGFGIPLLDAMTYGVPVLCHDIPSLRELAADSAAWFSVEDFDGLHRYLTRLDRDPDWGVELGRTGRARAAEFSPRRVGSLLWEQYASFL
ncbi:MAG: glycosyltransferase family 4 protein [Caldilineaceae bacterium SB0665_bin_21]|nr:glycosyltransferase family 4 protein [Caldilineaceae bacterium SB0665_bin_21]